MNFIFISPHFPNTYWEFCQRLKQNGVKVLAIADTPYENLTPELRDAITEYYRVDSLDDYDQMYRAVAYFAFRHGRIDWIESNNEYWLEQDARLRTDFNVSTGLHSDKIRFIKEKSKMKRIFQDAFIPTARQIQCEEGFNKVKIFCLKTGWPVIAKPNVGVGASGTYKLHNEEELSDFFNSVTDSNLYVVEEFVTGEICSYDAVINSKGEPLF